MSTLHQAVTICATARLSRGLQDAHERKQISLGLTQWAAPYIVTLSQWLDKTTNEALLLGKIDAFSLPNFVLSNVAEQLLWEEVITKSLQKNGTNQIVDTTTLFDIKSLSQSAIEANKLIIEWQLDENALNTNAQSTFTTEETRQFLRWRHEFQRLCSHHKTLDSARYLALQIHSLQKAELSLPRQMNFVGYDRFTPLEQQLISFLKSAGVIIDMLKPLAVQAQNLQVAYVDNDAECRAATAWAKAILAAKPNAQLAIISPVLGNLRDKLNYLLDDTFHPETLHPKHYEAPRCYDFSIGLPLTQHPIIKSALHILKCSLPHTKLSQPECAILLQDAYFGKTTQNGELDNRALFDLDLRRKSGHTLNLAQFIYQAEVAIAKGLSLSKLLAHLTQMQQLSNDWPKKQLPSAWRLSFISLLKAVNWASSHELSSHDYQTQQAWLKALDEFATLDSLLGNINAFEAMQRLAQLTHSTMFQPEAIGETHIQLLGLLETVAVQLDGIWVMGMNDQHWPPAAKPNPLLPAQLQRSHGTPNASAQVQADFAKLIHQRLSKSASEVIFSYALKDGDRELRASPVLENVPLKNPSIDVSLSTLTVHTLAETLAHTPAETMQYVDDHIAPVVSTEEVLRGGSQLLKAQAICPAWAFYQYRLGAKVLKEPTDGLDSMTRGTLVHSALQCFWLECSNLSALKAMSEQTMQAAIAKAVANGITQFCASQGIIMPPQIMLLEQYRLQLLLNIWLVLECERADFKVQACEKEMTLNLAGISIKVIIDRIDELMDGGLVIIDYKTGSAVETKSWAEPRITEPQLPLYAAIAAHAAHIVAVCFGKVTTDNCQFIGIAAQDDVLPNVKDLTKVRTDSAFKQFSDWDSLILHWKASLEAIAEEIKNGEAAVRFKDEVALAYCEVKPLLRLPERLLQFEQMQKKSLEVPK